MQRTTWRGAAVGALAMLALSGCGMVGDQRPAGSAGQVVTLEGRNEVPPVTTTAVGTANVTVNHDRTVVVKVIVSGLTPTAGHIHEGAPGTNGPVAVPFAKLGDNEFVTSPDARLTEAQYEAYKKGNLYVNVHSAKHPRGGNPRADPGAVTQPVDAKEKGHRSGPLCLRAAHQAVAFAVVAAFPTSSRSTKGRIPPWR